MVQERQVIEMVEYDVDSMSGASSVLKGSLIGNVSYGSFGRVQLLEKGLFEMKCLIFN